MFINMMKSKIHRATVTDADLAYEGSISIDTKLIELAGLMVNERVEIYNCNNGARFSTYVIPGGDGEICLNGAAARHAHKGDVVIIVSYAQMTQDEAETWKQKVVMVDGNNQAKNFPEDPVGDFNQKF